jgi:DNA-binding transcriptional MerR regulator
MDDDRLTAVELAALLRVKPQTIRVWQRLGLPYTPAGRKKFYSKFEVQQWLWTVDRAKQRAKLQKAKEQQMEA